MSIKSIDSNEIAYVSVEGDRVLLDIEDTEEVCLQCCVFSKEAAQALGAALLAAASPPDICHRVHASWNEGAVEVTFVPGWLQIDFDDKCIGFNASEAKALLAAIASCVAAMEAANGGDGDAR